MMNTCGNAIAECTGLAGCGGRLCRNMRHALSRMEFVRRVSENESKNCVLCGFITKLRPPSDPKYAVPGILGTASNVRLTVVSSSEAPAVGDTVYADGKCYCVQSQLSELPVRFSLIERADDNEPYDE